MAEGRRVRNEDGVEKEWRNGRGMEYGKEREIRMKIHAKAQNNLISCAVSSSCFVLDMSYTYEGYLVQENNFSHQIFRHWPRDLRLKTFAFIDQLE